MNQPLFQPLSAFSSGYRLLPFRFGRIPNVPGVLVTSEAGEFTFLSDDEFRSFVDHRLDTASEAFSRLRVRHIAYSEGGAPLLEPMAAQYRTRKQASREGPSLHIFVVTLRCDHACQYCQVSPKRVGAHGFDMSAETARHAVDRMFESSAQTLTVEFQGGETVLAFERILDIVAQIELRNELERRKITFVVATTLHLLTEEQLTFCKDHDIHLSSSLDGPVDVHNANRPNLGRDSFERTVGGIARAREALGQDKVAALATVTRRSLPYAERIVDCYVELGFSSIFLRPLSPYGHAVRSWRTLGYSAEEFALFYERALNHLIAANAAGIFIEEAYATLLLTHILTPFSTGYMDLRSPASPGLGVLVYNYDGYVYASDEGRMLKEMGDERFRLGRVDQTYAELVRSPAMQWLLSAGVAEALPGCSDCVFLPYCGADPVFHVASQDDPVGHRPTSAFCRRQTTTFQTLFRKLAERDASTMRVFLSWLGRRSTATITHPGYMAG